MVEEEDEERLRLAEEERIQTYEMVKQKMIHYCHDHEMDEEDMKPMVKRYLATKNEHPNDSRMHFDPGPHRYYIDGKSVHIVGVSTLIHSFFKAFDSRKQAESTVSSKTFQESKHRINYQYHGCTTADDVISVWNRKRDEGTALHDTIERYLNGEPYTVDPCNQECFQMFLELWKQNTFSPLQHWRTEMSVFDPEARICGTVDYIGFNPQNGRYYMLDWKRVENITMYSFSRMRKEEPEYGYGPCNVLENCKHSTYSLQLNLYRYMLEKYYDIKIEDMYLIQMHPVVYKKAVKAGVTPLPWIHRLPDMRSIVQEIINYRMDVLEDQKKMGQDI